MTMKTKYFGFIIEFQTVHCQWHIQSERLRVVETPPNDTTRAKIKKKNNLKRMISEKMIFMYFRDQRGQNHCFKNFDLKKKQKTTTRLHHALYRKISGHEFVLIPRLIMLLTQKKTFLNTL